MKITLELPSHLAEALANEGCYSLDLPRDGSMRPAEWQARQIIEAGLKALEQAGPARCRDIAFALYQRPHPSRRPAGATEQP